MCIPLQTILVRDGASIGARFRPSQGEAGHLFAIGQPRQPEIFLGLGAVVHQQFARAQEFGTMTVTATLRLLVAMRVTMVELAIAENSLPP